MTRRADPATPDFAAVLPAPFGALGISTADGALCEIVFLPPGSAALAPRDAVAEAACAQLARYLHDPDAPFELPLAPGLGSDFRRRVWREIARIPRGEIRRYGELARTLGSAARAVGQACGDNPFPLVVPCHRVVSSAAGGLGGFAHARDGFRCDIKRWLLAHEGVPLG